MNALATAIQSRGLSGTAAEIRTAHAHLGNPRVDSTSYSLSGVMQELAKLGVSSSILLHTAPLIRSLPAGGDTFEKMLITGGGESGGVDFSLPAIQVQLDYNAYLLAGNEAAADALTLVQNMMLIGVRPQTAYQEDGFETQPPVEDYQAALDELAGVTYDRRHVLLSLNLTPQASGEQAIFSMQVIPARLVNGVMEIDGANRTVITAVDARNTQHTGKEKQLIDAVLAAVDEYLA